MERILAMDVYIRNKCVKQPNLSSVNVEHNVKLHNMKYIRKGLNDMSL